MTAPKFLYRFLFNILRLGKIFFQRLQAKFFFDQVLESSISRAHSICHHLEIDLWIYTTLYKLHHYIGSLVRDEDSIRQETVRYLLRLYREVARNGFIAFVHDDIEHYLGRLSHQDTVRIDLFIKEHGCEFFSSLPSIHNGCDKNACQGKTSSRKSDRNVIQDPDIHLLNQIAEIFGKEKIGNPS